MLNRRDFIKIGSTLSFATTLSANSLAKTTSTLFDNKTMLGSNHFGVFNAHVNTDSITSVTPFRGDKFPTSMIQAMPDMRQNQTRISWPMVRKSYLEAKGPSDNDERGKEEFVRVPWKTALDLAAKAIKDNFDKHGPESIYGECYSWGGSGSVSSAETISQRMFNVLGGCVREYGDYSTGAGLAIMPYVLGNSAVYEKATKWKGILKHARNIVFWGTDPIRTNQISGSSPTHDSYKYFKQLKAKVQRKEINVFSVDAKHNDTGRYLDTKLMNVKPNTDTAMMVAMAYYLYKNDLYDKNFIRKYTVGFNKFRDYFLGKDDDTPKTPLWAEKICGIKASEIENFAKKLRKEKTLILVGRALQRADHGEQPFWMITVLNAMLGHIGKTGLGFDFSLAYHCEGVNYKVAPVLKGISTAVNPEYTKKYSNGPWAKYSNYWIPTSRSIEALQNPGKVIDYNGGKLTLPHMRVLYFAAGSPLTRSQDANNAVDSFKKVDTIITAEPYWTSQAKMSDIIFPVAIETERTDISDTSPTREFILARKAITSPVGESQSDFWICKELCKRWGYEEVFTEGKDEFGWVKHFYEDAQKQAKALHVPMPSFEKFWEKGYVQFPKDDNSEEYYTRLADFVKNPHRNKLGTPSGKIQIYSPRIASYNYDDCKGYPSWIEPIEWLGSKVAEDYPLHIVSPHSKYRLHSQLNNSLIRGFNEVSGREPILMHPKNAKKRGLKTNDIVRVFNTRGEVLAGVIVTSTVREDVAILCEGAWYSPVEWGEKSLCLHGNANILTIDKGASKLSQSNIAHTCLAQVEKYEDEILPVNAFVKPKILQNI